MLLVEAGRTLVTLELPLRMKVEVLDVLLFVEEAFPALPTLVGFDAVNTDHVGSELRGLPGTNITDSYTCSHSARIFTCNTGHIGQVSVLTWINGLILKRIQLQISLQAQLMHVKIQNQAMRLLTLLP